MEPVLESLMFQAWIRVGWACVTSNLQLIDTWMESALESLMFQAWDKVGWVCLTANFSRIATCMELVLESLMFDFGGGGGGLAPLATPLDLRKADMLAAKGVWSYTTMGGWVQVRSKPVRTAILSNIVGGRKGAPLGSELSHQLGVLQRLLFNFHYQPRAAVGFDACEGSKVSSGAPTGESETLEIR